MTNPESQFLQRLSSARMRLRHLKNPGLRSASAPFSTEEAEADARLVGDITGGTWRFMNQATKNRGLRSATAPLSPEEAEGENWFVPPLRLLDPRKWTVDVHSVFPELLAKEYTLLWARLPYQLHYLVNLFENSRELLDLQDDWDGNGGKAYTEEHWRRAISFLADNALWLWEREQLCMPEPRIIPGPERTIDIHWKSNQLEFLVNIPENPSLPVNFYGDDYKHDAVNGTFDLAHDNFWLMLWLVGRQ